jgi:hypothetical protein
MKECYSKLVNNNDFRKKNSLANLDKIDTKNYLMKANRDIKCLNYELANIV